MNALLLAVSIAAALAVPALAQTAAPSASAPAGDAMSAGQAEAAVDAAYQEAAKSQLDNVPVELARATIMVPYGEETLPGDPTPDHLRRIVAAKRGYWARVHDALAKELAKTPEDEPIDEAISYVGPNTARRMALSRHIVDCERILADIEADAKVDASTPGQSILARKKALMSELTPRRGRITDDGRGPCP